MARYGIARYGIRGEQRLGVAIPELRRLAKEIGKNHELALALWQTGIPDAMILASMIELPTAVSEAQMEAWVQDFNSWDVCDQVCMNLFEKTPLAWRKIHEWCARQEEYVKRAAFALIACLAWHDKQAGDQQFIELLPVVLAGAGDERNFVKKAVSWALRNLGKRNDRLRQAVLETAALLRQMEAKSAKWIGADVARDLQRAE
jgi:3-methyladenine DNA glycosylase AlkD